MFKTVITTAFGSVLGGTLLLTAGLGLAQAEPAPPPGGDGLIDVVVGGATYLDSVPTAQAAQEVTQMCAVAAPAANAMVTNVDTVGGSQTACTGSPHGDVVVVQNQPAGVEVSPVVPGTKAQFQSKSAQPAPPGGSQITGNLPTSPDNMSSLN